jgi:uncharacterized membrane protein YkoI
MMRKIIGMLGVGAVAAVVLVVAARAEDKAKKVPLDKVPKAIMDAIQGRFPGGRVSSVEKEIEDGKVVYDVELKHQGRHYEMDIHEDGTIVEIEKEIALKDAPEALAQTVQAKYPKATIKEVMEVNSVKDKKETPIHYEVTVETSDKKERELIVSLDGKSIRKEEKENEKD